MTSQPTEAWIFDFDNHYYESQDAFTRHLDRSFANRGVRWAEIDGRRRLLVAGTVNNYVANPTFDPVSRPGALFDWYRGNPQQADFEMRSASSSRSAPSITIATSRLRSSRRRAWAGSCCSRPWRRHRGTARARSRSVPRGVPRLQPLARRGLGLPLRGTTLRGSVHPAPRPCRGRRGATAVLDRGAVVVNVRNAPVPVPGGHRSPFDPAYDGFWGLAADAGVVVATHAGLDGYSVLVDLGTRRARVLAVPLSAAGRPHQGPRRSATSTAPRCASGSSSDSPACGWQVLQNHHRVFDLIEKPLGTQQLLARRGCTASGPES